VDHLVTHIPSGFCALTVSIFEEHDYKLHRYSGENVMDEFYNYMNREEQRIRTILNQNNAMIELTEDQNVSYVLATVCDTCKKELSPIRPKMRHHCHVTGRYIGPVCQSCNLQLKSRTWNEFFVTCFFHNSSAYDSHLITKNLHKKQSKITVIPSNTKQFIGFQIDGIRYLDSYKFLSSSLDDLVKNLHNNGVDHFKYMRHTFSDGDPNIFENGVYPYEYMTSRDIFKQSSLPSMSEFYSKLTRSSAMQRDRARHLSVEILQLQNISLENPIVWHYLRDSTFSHFYTIPECDRHTHRRTDTRRRHIPHLA